MQVSVAARLAPPLSCRPPFGLTSLQQVDGALDVEEAGSGEQCNAQMGGEQCHAQMQEDANAEDDAEEEEGPDGEMRFEVLADDAWSVARPPGERESSLLTTYWSESTLSS